MNVWECEHIGCKRKCFGTGGAIGLRAIGWYFIYAGPILCPEHRPDPVPCHDKWRTEGLGEPCALCAADDDAERWQAPMETAYRFPDRVDNKYSVKLDRDSE